MPEQTPPTEEAAELICVDKDYNEVDCADPAAAYHTTREDAKAHQDAQGEPPAQPEGKAVTTAPANKALDMPKGKK